MNDQPQLFYEGPSDALRAVVQALGGAKKVGTALRPDKSMEDAGRWVLDCTNPERRERFDPDQVLWLIKEGRRIGFHAAMNYFASEAGYAVTPLDPNDELAELQRKFIESVKQNQRIADRIEQLTRSPLQAVK